MALTAAEAQIAKLLGRVGGGGGQRRERRRGGEGMEDGLKSFSALSNARMPEGKAIHMIYVGFRYSSTAGRTLDEV